MSSVNTPPTEDEVLTDHVYDGIREYDNPTPGWWNWLFVATIVWSPIYIVWFHTPVQERTLSAQFNSALAANMQLRFGELGDLQPDQATLVRFMNDTDWLASGAASYGTHCATCHGQKGEGKNGPNLTDNFYKPANVTELTDIAKVIANGANAGAMPAWKTKLHPTELVLVSAYVASLRGRNEAGRQAEGSEIAAWPTVAEVSSDSGSEIRIDP